MRFDTYELYYLDTYDEEAADLADDLGIEQDDPYLSLIHISEPTRPY